MTDRALHATAERSELPPGPPGAPYVLLVHSEAIPGSSAHTRAYHLTDEAARAWADDVTAALSEPDTFWRMEDDEGDHVILPARSVAMAVVLRQHDEDQAAETDDTDAYPFTGAEAFTSGVQSTRTDHTDDEDTPDV